MSTTPPSRRLYMRNLPRYVDHKSLLKHLSTYGKITEVKMLHDYAFVQFESQQDAQDVVETFQKQPFLGESITIEFARPKRKDMRLSANSTVLESPSNISPRPIPENVNCRYPVIISNIPRRIRWQDLKDFGRTPGGLVAFCDLDKKHPGRGFVEYFTKEDAERAVVELDNTFLGGQRVRVSGRPEALAARLSRSRSPPRRAVARHKPSYDGRSRSHYASNTSALDDYESRHAYRRSDDHCPQYGRSQTPANYPKSLSPSYETEKHPTNLNSYLRHLNPLPSDYRGLEVEQESRYEQQQYNGYGSMSDVWKYDFDNSAGHLSNSFDIPLEQVYSY